MGSGINDCRVFPVSATTNTCSITAHVPMELANRIDEITTRLERSKNWNTDAPPAQRCEEIGASLEAVFPDIRPLIIRAGLFHQ